MFLSILQDLGLSKNESLIYQTLLQDGEMTVSEITQKSQVHRRNVYDTMVRLLEKGLVFEVFFGEDTKYQAVDPQKLLEMLQEKQRGLIKIMPDLYKMYESTPRKNEVYMYKGVEGWKNYMRDMVRIGQPIYSINAKGQWLDERVKHFFPQFLKEVQKQNVPFFSLFDANIKSQCAEIIKHAGAHYKFLPEKYSAPCAVDIFGDHVNILQSGEVGKMGEEIVFTVVVNKNIADSFRTWFQFMWDMC